MGVGDDDGGSVRNRLDMPAAHTQSARTDFLIRCFSEDEAGTSRRPWLRVPRFAVRANRPLGVGPLYKKIRPCGLGMRGRHI